MVKQESNLRFKSRKTDYEIDCDRKNYEIESKPYLERLYHIQSLKAPSFIIDTINGSFTLIEQEKTKEEIWLIGYIEYLHNKYLNPYM